MKKLNVGCGGRPKDGYDNLDIDPKWNPDILADALNMHMIPDETYSEVHSYGFIEHIKPKDIPTVLLEMKRVLKKRGEIQIGTEDFEFQVKLYREQGINKWTRSAIFGPNYFHREILDEKTLFLYLKDAGFKYITRLFPTPETRKKYDFPEGILFMVARK